MAKSEMMNLGTVAIPENRLFYKYVKDDLAQLDPKKMTEKQFKWALLRVLHSISASLDSISYTMKTESESK